MSKAFLFLLCIFLGSAIQAQNLVSSLGNQLDQYQNSFPQLRPYLIFNQEKYAPGDTAYFKIYFFTENLRPVGGRHILQLSVINFQGKEVITENIGVKDGIGFNQLALPDSLREGIYQFVVCNDWMKNFDHTLFFKKEILIVNKKEIKKAEYVGKKNIFFFPESEKLIGDVSNKVVIKAEGFSDKESGIIIEKNGDRRPITQFSLNSNGLASLIFIPQSGKNYVAEISGQQFDLPIVEKDGITILMTTNANREPMRMLLTAPDRSVYRTQDLNLIVTSYEKIYYSATVSLNEKEFVQVLIPQTSLPAGIARLSVFSKDEKLVDRLLLINTDPLKIIFSETPETIQTRGKVSLDFAISDASNESVPAEFAVTALNQKLFPSSETNSFADNLHFFNETGDENFLVDKNDPNWYSVFDQWLITKKPKRFSWERVTHPLEHKHELSTTLTIKAKGYFEDTGNPLPDSTLIMIYLQKNLVAYEAYVKDGKFDFDFFFDFYGTDAIFYVAEFKGKELKKVKVEVEKESSETNANNTFTLNESNKPDPYAEFNSKKRLIQKSYSFYASPSQEPKLNLINLHEDFEDNLMGADISVNVQDYIVFPTMEEMIREVIPALVCRKQGGEMIVRTYLSAATVVPTGDPLYLIDGIMTKNTQYFLSLKPVDVLSVKIFRDFNKLHRFGAMGKNGIVIVQSKKKDLKKLRESSTLLFVNGLTKPIHFNNADHSVTSATRIPDFRSTLYWNPLMKTDKNGKGTISFYTSDDIGPIEIKITGMTLDGRPFSGSKIINVLPALTGLQKK
jgi:hypothetical protein